jgi:hypothetical protein
MRPQRFCCLAGMHIVTTWFLCLVGHATAHANIAFMPGDAFFHAELTTAVTKGLQGNGGKVILSYSHAPLSGGFGGYAGFERVEITNVPIRMTSALRSVYADLRQEYPEIVRVQLDAEGNEVNRDTSGFHLFVYNRNVKWRLEWNDQKIGIKYNEHWNDLPDLAITPTEGRPSGFGRVPAIEYASFIQTYAAVVEDWRNARRFDELKVAVPSGIPWGLTGPEIMEPVSVDANDVQLVVCPDDDLKLYFAGKRDLQFFTISVDGVKRFTWTKKGLIAEDYEVDRRKSDSPPQ